MTVAIKVENLSKVYQIGQIGTGTISRDIERWWITKVMGKDDPFLKLGETNDRTVKGKSNVVWSLKDVNFEIQQGDAVGIIGRNGAGKTTLLKLLSRVTSPATGTIKIKGRVASLLEVGTGFHPELTGRENIYLNGSILGMRKKEIDRKFGEIVDFSGVERYIDTPVKRYSVGMSVRLAFAVAAHLESEILIVDEVLAVGDAEFQKKCLGKMEDVGQREGRTVLFVSHNLSNIKRLCHSALLLENGHLEFEGAADSVINHYTCSRPHTPTNGFIKGFLLENPDIMTGKNLKMSIELKDPFDSTNKKILLRIRDDRNINIIRFEIQSPERRIREIIIETEPLILTQGSYFIDVALTDNKNSRWIEKFREVGKFSVTGLDNYGVGRIFTNQMALITPKFDCHFNY